MPRKTKSSLLDKEGIFIRDKSSFNTRCANCAFSRYYSEFKKHEHLCFRNNPAKLSAYSCRGIKKTIRSKIRMLTTYDEFCNVYNSAESRKLVYFIWRKQ